MAAFARAEDRLRALEAGYDAHVAKPVDETQALQVIHALVNRRDEPTRV